MRNVVGPAGCSGTASAAAGASDAARCRRQRTQAVRADRSAALHADAVPPRRDTFARRRRDRRGGRAPAPAARAACARSNPTVDPSGSCSSSRFADSDAATIAAKSRSEVGDARRDAARRSASRLLAGTYARSGPSGSVDRLPNQVGMAGVPSGLFDHVQQDPTRVFNPDIRREPRVDPPRSPLP